MKDKFILDACCGTKMFWTNKNHPNVLYMDIRKEEQGFIEQQPNLSIKPDVIGDFTKLPEEVKRNKYKLIIWDVPHFVKRKITGIMLKKFGCLNPETWQSDITKGFKELWDVLDDYGVLLFKFSDYHIKFDKILKCIPEKPLIYNKMNSKGGTECKWFCFMKIPEGKKALITQEGLQDNNQQEIKHRKVENSNADKRERNNNRKHRQSVSRHKDCPRPADALKTNNQVDEDNNSHKRSVYADKPDTPRGKERK